MELDPGKWKNDLKKKLNEYKRVLQIATKPDTEEFEMAAKVTGAGIIIIGVIGFVFYIASNLIPIYFGGGQQASQGTGQGIVLVVGGLKSIDMGVRK